jgi:hypothetical protein
MTKRASLIIHTHKIIRGKKRMARQQSRAGKKEKEGLFLGVRASLASNNDYYLQVRYKRDANTYRRETATPAAICG